jgi:hypothetical protein
LWASGTAAMNASLATGVGTKSTPYLRIHWQNPARSRQFPAVV